MHLELEILILARDIIFYLPCRSHVNIKNSLQQQSGNNIKYPKRGKEYEYVTVGLLRDCVKEKVYHIYQVPNVEYRITTIYMKESRKTEVIKFQIVIVIWSIMVQKKTKDRSDIGDDNLRTRRLDYNNPLLYCSLIYDFMQKKTIHLFLKNTGTLVF